MSSVGAPSIFHPEDRAALVARIRRLSASSKRAWGKMDPGQAAAHCQVPLRVALGEQTIRRGLVGRLFGGMAKKSLLKSDPFKRGLPTDKAFLVRDARDVAVERERLVVLLERLGSGGEASLTKAPHPFFGPLTALEWDRLMWKHLDHHLRQFGA